MIIQHVYSLVFQRQDVAAIVQYHCLRYWIDFQAINFEVDALKGI